MLAPGRGCHVHVLLTRWAARAAGFSGEEEPLSQGPVPRSPHTAQAPAPRLHPGEGALRTERLSTACPPWPACRGTPAVALSGIGTVVVVLFSRCRLQGVLEPGSERVLGRTGWLPTWGSHTPSARQMFSSLHLRGAPPTDDMLPLSRPAWLSNQWG